MGIKMKHEDRLQLMGLTKEALQNPFTADAMRETFPRASKSQWFHWLNPAYTAGYIPLQFAADVIAAPGVKGSQDEVLDSTAEMSSRIPQAEQNLKNTQRQIDNLKDGFMPGEWNYKQFGRDNSLALGAGAGGLAGAGLGALIAGKNNRLMGGLTGGVLGAGTGALASHLLKNYIK